MLHERSRRMATFGGTRSAVTWVTPQARADISRRRAPRCRSSRVGSPSRRHTSPRRCIDRARCRTCRARRPSRIRRLPDEPPIGCPPPVPPPIPPPPLRGRPHRRRRPWPRPRPRRHHRSLLRQPRHAPTGRLPPACAIPPTAGAPPRPVPRLQAPALRAPRPCRLIFPHRRPPLRRVRRSRRIPS